MPTLRIRLRMDLYSRALLQTASLRQSLRERFQDGSKLLKLQATALPLKNPTECIRSKTPKEILSAFSKEDTAIGANLQFRLVANNILVYADYSSQRSARSSYLMGNNQNEAGIFQLMQPNQIEAYQQDFKDRLCTYADAERLAQSIVEGNPSQRYCYFRDFPNLAVSTDLLSGAYYSAKVCQDL